MDDAGVTVAVPYRGGDPDRDRAWKFVREWWAKTHPTYRVIEGHCPDGPWRKALAVADAVRGAPPGHTLVVADADVVCFGVEAAVAALSAHGWAIPHLRVHRLTPAATLAVLAGGPLPDPHPNRRSISFTFDVARAYQGVEGGGLVVVSGAAWARVPMDPRFAGWGQEDLSWAHALSTTFGAPFRGSAPLWHLHHETPPRLDERAGNAEGVALYHRYLAAKTPAAVAALIDEFRALAWG